jgi:hypothetical protein
VGQARRRRVPRRCEQTRTREDRAQTRDNMYCLTSPGTRSCAAVQAMRDRLLDTGMHRSSGLTRGKFASKFDYPRASTPRQSSLQLLRGGAMRRDRRDQPCHDGGSAAKAAELSSTSSPSFANASLIVGPSAVIVSGDLSAGPPRRRRQWVSASHNARRCAILASSSGSHAQELRSFSMCVWPSSLKVWGER